MTGQEIIDKLKAKDNKTEYSEDYRIEDFAHEDYIPPDLKEELGEVKEVAHGGGMDEGSTWYSVKHFIKHDVYLKVNGYYQSHYGTDIYDWSHVQIVTPQERTITVYE